MSETRPFNEIKLQWLSLLTQDGTLSSTAVVVAVYIVTTHYNQEKGYAWPSYETIAKATCKNAKTIQRAVKELETFWFTIKRGNGLGHSTEFAPSQISIIAASDLREKNDKIVPLHSRKGRQNGPERMTNSSRQGGQNCPPKKETKSNKEKRKHVASQINRCFPRIFIPKDSHNAQAWQDWLQDRKLPSLEKMRPLEHAYGRPGFVLPATYPPSDLQMAQHIQAHLVAGIAPLSLVV